MYEGKVLLKDLPPTYLYRPLPT